MSFRRFRRHQAFSPTSSATLSPTDPMIESPINLHALASRIVSDVSLRRKKKPRRPAEIPSVFLEETEDDDAVVPNVVRLSSMDVKAENAAQHNIEEAQACQNKTQYYEDVFSSRGPQYSPEALVAHESIIVIEIKTNTKVKEEELKLVSDLSFRLAQIYQRPETSMMVTIQQEACLHFGNLSLPAYLMKVSAHPYLIAPITNLRNTIFIQQALQEFLDITPSRGVIIYTSVPEENFATNGVTTMGEITNRDHDAENEDVGVFKSISRSMSRKLKSSSSDSAPLSITTMSSSWPQGPVNHGSGSGSDKDGHSKVPSGEESQPQSVRNSRSLRDFVSRRVGDLGSQDEKQ